MQGWGGGGGGGGGGIISFICIVYCFLYILYIQVWRERDWYHVKLFFSNLDICFLFI